MEIKQKQNVHVTKITITYFFVSATLFPKFSPDKSFGLSFNWNNLKIWCLIAPIAWHVVF